MKYDKRMVPMCLMPFYLLLSIHYYEPSSPQQPPVVCIKHLLLLLLCYIKIPTSLSENVCATFPFKNLKTE
jgi:hypothetical protein